ncbi:hypothetical protein [Sphingobium sp. SCG-1]|uniref:hypothetical protein n=1 Tax=Sphingobium sp. SCG-1 TaxID=2072936 RepID=UPI001671758B|nr:hypothetical protein [Sphingobium sp. SCG-1]
MFALRNRPLRSETAHKADPPRANVQPISPSDSFRQDKTFIDADVNDRLWSRPAG